MFKEKVLYMHHATDITWSKWIALISKSSLIGTWARENGMKWVYHIPYHVPASGKIKWYNGLLKTGKAMDGGAF